MYAEIFVLHHQTSGLGQRRGGVQKLVLIQRRSGESFSQFLLVAVAGDREAKHWADVDAGVALDATRRSEDGLDIAVQATQNFARGLFSAEAEFHFDVQLLESPREIDVLHLLTRRGVVIIVVTPLADAHLAAEEIHLLRRPFGNGDSVAVVVDRYCRLMPVFYRPDDVLRSPRGVAAEENSGS